MHHTFHHARHAEYALCSEKQTWMEEVVKDFNARQMTACDGPITVNATPIGSGDSMQQIMDGTSQPDIWSPAGSVWLTLLNQQWTTKYGKPFTATPVAQVPRLVSSPVVIAMWQPLAQALGWPSNHNIGWSTIAALSANPNGWGAYGHPEYGAFKFGHTQPFFSNSGLDAVIAANYAAVGKTSNLTASDVSDPDTQTFVEHVEDGVIHYGDSTGFFADEMLSKGPSYLSAAVLYENLVVSSYSQPNPQNFPKLVAIYPKEGTFISDHPFIIPQTGWMTPAKTAAAQAFGRFLQEGPQQQKALQAGFRPALGVHTAVGAPIDAAHGVDPDQPKNLLEIPSAALVNQMLQSWAQFRRKVDVILVLDRSGSMDGIIAGKQKITEAKAGMNEFVGLLGDGDSLGVTTFSDSAQVLTPVTPIGPKRAAVIKDINAITADGSTQLYDTIASQRQALAKVSDHHIKALVVLTDGEDTASTLSLAQLLSAVKPSGADAGEAPKIFTIAYGADADATILSQIATATGGQEYDGTPQNILTVYSTISRFFS
jgi:Ca-activated chloride channel homolog